MSSVIRLDELALAQSLRLQRSQPRAENMFSSPSKQASSAASAEQGISNTDIQEAEAYDNSQEQALRGAISGLGQNPYFAAAQETSPSGYVVNPNDTATFGSSGPGTTSVNNTVQAPTSQTTPQTVVAPSTPVTTPAPPRTGAPVTRPTLPGNQTPVAGTGAPGAGNGPFGTSWSPLNSRMKD